MLATKTKTRCAACGENKPQLGEAIFRAHGGLCPTCARLLRVRPVQCRSCGGFFPWNGNFASAVGHEPRPKQVCPTCDSRRRRAAGDDDARIVVERRALFVVPEVEVACDLGSGTEVQSEAHRSADRTPVVRYDVRARTTPERLAVYDSRVVRDDPALVRVMSRRHQGVHQHTGADGHTYAFSNEGEGDVYVTLEPPISGTGLPSGQLSLETLAIGETPSPALWSFELRERDGSGRAVLLTAR